MTERRQQYRDRTLRGARIAFGNMSITMDCVVRDLTPGGARLRLPSTIGVPSMFHLLHERDGSIRRCRLAWRTETEVGVEFIDQAAAAQGAAGT
ncbi:PilZ domain-containing protein [Blastochloris sulfoviridis]|uniref:PilZ domain-containing protein n=1 Tax=Blastochloris sulfoviridis TaxID=50712 RepID=A0A5M6HNU4_9HYPH|nr:PilZ domain-containing protein [Blastochloris sulfoviridis]KAA5597269.1 PilZ domain-containing protein [Blastochloris sulfoviridis]